MDYSIRNFLVFLDELDKYINPETSRNITLTAKRLLSNTDSGLALSTDIRNVDFEKIVAREYAESNISEKAKKTYVGRMNSGLKYFIQYLNGDKVHVVRGGIKAVRKPISETVEKAVPESTKTFVLPIPIREGLILNISNLPLDLTEEEADKISRIIKSYAVIKS
ncbi:hypothetical protein [Gilliamella sp. WF3-4]|jgi:hypothetical protein|uniref:hypothetical protein n=1 Tax=Gilliamella sp. WF3-4 TaxID=3120255 RepID=UPI00080E5B40|nr:hypothetical protein [Gilliamella apicola]OCG19371.1 hypothetical protein A9G47_03750 [Gilliamella apicola]